MVARLRVVASGVLVGAALVGAGGAVWAAPSFVVGDGPHEPSDGKVTIEVINLSGAELVVDLESETCASTNTIKVPADTVAEATFELEAGCTVETPVAATVVGRSGEADHSVPIQLTQSDDDSDSDLSPLIGFGVGLGAAFVLAVAALMAGREKQGWRVYMSEPMPWLGKDWKFDESWAANAGLAAAVFTGLFGATDVLDELLGEDGDTAVAVIGAAITAGLVGAAPMLLMMCKSKGEHTRVGVLLGSWAVLAAHFGLIITLVLMLGGDGDAALPATIAGIGAVALLVTYVLRTLPGVFEGQEVTKKTEPDVLALQKIAAAVDRISRQQGLGIDELTAMDETAAAEPSPRAALI